MIARKNNCHLTCVDIFNEFPPDENNPEEIKRQFKANMAEANAKYNLMNVESSEASEGFDSKIDLLFIDGDHSYKGVKSDIKLWLPKVKIGGFVLFHDYGGIHPGVKKAVDETGLIKLEVVETLLVAKKNE